MPQINKSILFLSLIILVSSCSVLRTDFNKKDKQGLKERGWIEYNQDKKQIIIANYKQGVLNGYYKTYHLNGQISSVGKYMNNVPVGKWLFYFENGFCYKKNIHNNKGEITRRTLYNPINF